jgi:hypothetical protein
MIAMWDLLAHDYIFEAKNVEETVRRYEGMGQRRFENGLLGIAKGSDTGLQKNV